MLSFYQNNCLSAIIEVLKFVQYIVILNKNRKLFSSETQLQQEILVSI